MSDRRLLTTRNVLIIALLLRAVAFFLPPGLSDDAWRYAWDGLVQAHGVNPYLHEPRDPALGHLHASPALAGMNSAHLHSVYPPLSQVVFLAGGLVERAGASTLASLYLIKLLLALAEIGGLLLLARLVPARLLILYAWHPLVILESAGQAHTESLLVGSLVLCLWAFTQGRPRLAGAALGAAVMVKLYPVVLLPFLWRRMGSASVWPALLVIAVLAAPYASLDGLANVRGSLRLYVTQFEFNALPYFLLRDLANWLEPGPADMGKLFLGQLLQGLFLALIFVLLWLDWRRGWPLDKAFGMVLSVFFLCSTTIHPWYLLGLLALPWTLGAPPPEQAWLRRRRPVQWHWVIFGLLSLGTYLRYVDHDASERWYLGFVWIAWGAWLALLLLPRRNAIQWLLQVRAGSKARRLKPFLPDRGHILDLGAAEGYVGQAIADMTGARVVLADVVNLRKAPLPLFLYDGRRLPLENDSLDAVILYFVLHHARDPEAVLRESLRICRPRGRVLIVESVWKRSWERAVLARLDAVANRLRAGPEERIDPARFRTVQQWLAMARATGGRSVEAHEHGLPPHRQAVIVMSKIGPSPRAGPEDPRA